MLEFSLSSVLWALAYGYGTGALIFFAIWFYRCCQRWRQLGRRYLLLRQRGFGASDDPPPQLEDVVEPVIVLGVATVLWPLALEYEYIEWRDRKRYAERTKQQSKSPKKKAQKKK